MDNLEPAKRQAILAKVRVPIGSARGLPNENYICGDMFEAEKHAVLFKNWAGIGFGKDVPNPGDVKPVEFLGVPLLIVRGRDGSIGVFQNTCRHRGMILITEPTNIRGVIRCPYHSWCYDLDGSLRATPHVGGPGHNKHDDIDRDELGLLEIRSHVWRDVVFVNMSQDAPAFETYAHELMARWQEFEQPQYHGGDSASFKLDVKTNWKLAVENYCESYHLPWIHPGLNSYSRLQDHYHIEPCGPFSGQGTEVYRQLKDNDGLSFPDFAALSDSWNEGAEYIALYPNVLFGVHRDHSFAIILEPLGIDHTVEHIELYYAQDLTAQPQYGQLCDDNARQWQAIFDEDIFVVEGMQKGRHGVLFDGGKFSPAMDGPTHKFHSWVAAQLNGASS